MKWNIVIGSLVLGLGLSTQSFGFDLLDRMLGMDCDGCGSKVACCETKYADPGCGCEIGCDSKCGSCERGTPLLDKLRSRLASAACQKGCEKDCCEKTVDPGCGCEPTCGADPCCDSKGGKSCSRGTPLLDKLRCRLASLGSCKKKSDCCEKIVDPGCGCEPTCGADPCCESKCPQQKRCRVSLLDRIFACKSCDKGCCEKVVDPGCGCEPTCGMDFAPIDAPQEAEATEAAPTPPAPIVDPSAFLPTKRRFIQTSLVR